MARALDTDPREVLLGAVRHGVPRQRRDWTLVRGDGSVITAAMTVSAMRDDAGLLTGFLVLVQNVTDEREAHLHLTAALEAEREAVDRLEALDETRNDFVATVSHELRTPLTNIVGYTDVLLEDEVGPLSPAQRSMVERVDRNARRLRRQVEDLLLLGQVDAGTFHADRAPVSLGDVVDSAVAALDTETRDRVELEVSGDDTTVLGDGPRLVGVVRGLVDNALKFSPGGEPVHVHLRREGDDQVLEVVDAGPGIAPDDQEHLCQRFFRTGSARALAVQGLGLGLAVATAVVTAHEGAVDISSDQGHGTTVLVRLPAETTSAISPPRTPARP